MICIEITKWQYCKKPRYVSLPQLQQGISKQPLIQGSKGGVTNDQLLQVCQDIHVPQPLEDLLQQVRLEIQIADVEHMDVSKYVTEIGGYGGYGLLRAKVQL